MGNLLLYITVILIWGSTWVAITFQLGEVPETWSVAWRFLLAAAILHAWCFLRRKKMQFEARDHVSFAMLGFFLFCMNYFVFYHGTNYLTSGLVALIFSTMPLMNLVSQRLLFKIPVRPRVLFGSLVGLGGLALILAPEFSKVADTDSLITGIALCLLATFLASCGNMVSLRNQGRNLPILQTNAWGMLYGGLIMTVTALVLGDPIVIETSFAYFGSMVYLSLFGSIFAFGAYLTLIGRLGADKAAYSTVIFPIVALGLSTIFENYQWTAMAAIGILVVVAGNLIVISKPKTAPVPTPQEA